MNTVLSERAHNQRLVRPLRDPGSVVSHLVAMQAQDYAGAKWALALRTKDLTDEALDRAFDRGDILRTHVMRPTWHFVTPGDIRWLLQLTAPRVHAMNAPYYRASGLDGRTLARSERILERSLENRTFRTRPELAERLAKDGRVLSGLPLACVMMHAELEGIICSGPRRGKQFTYALLEERAAVTAPRSMDEALGELTRRYFATRGPATPRDFAWWAGLTIKQARTGIEMAGANLVADIDDEVGRWRVPGAPASRGTLRAVLLLPTYDELAMSYKDRRAMPAVPRPAGLRLGSLLPNMLVVEGELAGRWGRTITRRGTIVSIQPFRRLTKKNLGDVRAAVEQYGRFLNVPAQLSIVGPFTRVYSERSAGKQRVTR